MWTSVKSSDILCIWIALVFQTFSISSGSSCEGQIATAEEEDFTRVETGLEFIIQNNHRVELDDMLFFGSDDEALKRQGEHTSLEFIQIFIRNVKGLSSSETESKYEVIVSGTDMNKKPAYSYYPYLLRKLAKIEVKIYEILKEFKDETWDIPIPVLDSYLKDFEESSLRVLDTSIDSEDPYLYIATHPILIYRLIRRYAEDLQPILRTVEDLQPDVIDTLYQEANPELLVFPTKADLDDALNVISRMQHGNNLNTYKIARGILDNIDTGIHMNALHCLEIGAFYRDHKDFDFSIQWFHNALEKARKSGVAQYHAGIAEFFDLALQMAVNEHNTVFDEKLTERWYIGIFNSTVSLPFQPAAYIRRLTALNAEASKERHLTYWNWAIPANFKRVCSGENLQSEADKVFLLCWYHHQPHPYWYINPLKTELLHLNPPVFQIYEFIGDKLAERIKDTAVSQLKRSTVVDRKSATESKVDSTRTSSQTWLYDNEGSKFLLPLTQKLEMMSGLTIVPPSSSDAYQVAAYGPSHHYEAHIDSFEDLRRISEKGNRITTIMGYISQVKAGGRTGFPVLGIAAEPVKGSIVMWDNLKRNGEMRDERTWHGGCPVVLGVKWITNKWVYYKDNFLNFRCTLNPTS